MAILFPGRAGPRPLAAPVNPLMGAAAAVRRTSHLLRDQESQLATGARWTASEDARLIDAIVGRRSMKNHRILAEIVGGGRTATSVHDRLKVPSIRAVLQQRAIQGGFEYN